MPRTVSREEVAKHNTRKDLWIIIHGRVYDITNYIEDHPGGIPFLVENAGKDATEPYEDIGHSEDAREVLENHLVGPLEVSENESEKRSDVPKNGPRPVANLARSLDPEKIKHESSKTSLILIGGVGAVLVLSTSALLLSSRAFSKDHTLNVSGKHLNGFWMGFTGASIISLGAIGAAVQYASYIMTVPHVSPYSLPAHVKPRIDRSKLELKVGTLNPREYLPFPLVSKKKLSPNVYRFQFGLPKTWSILGLPIGQHVAIRHNVDGKVISRSYTPTSNNSDRGRLELVIKVYPDGAITPWLENLKVGDTVDFRGPKGNMKYNKDLCKEIGMVAGGTGITPCYSVIRAICEDPSDNTKVSLIYANNTTADILLKKELDHFAQTNPQKFKIHYVLSHPPPDWKDATGFTTKAMMQDWLPGPDKDNKIFLCGPPGMINAMKKNLEEMGFEKPGMVSKNTDQVFLF